MLVFKTVKQAVSRLAFSPDGSRVAAAGEARKIHLWNLTAAKHKRAVISDLNEPAVFLAFRPDGNLLAVTRLGQSVLHDPVTGATGLYAPDEFGWVGDVVATPDFSAFYGTGWRARKWTFDGGLRRVWDEAVYVQMRNANGGAALTPRGEYLAVVSGGQTPTQMHVRDAKTGALRAEHELATAPVHHLTLLPDGHTLLFVLAGGDRKQTTSALVVGKLGGLFAGTLAGPLKVVRTSGAADAFTVLAPHPSGRWIAAGQADGVVRVLDTYDWSEVAAYRWTEERVHGLTFAPDGLKAAAGFGSDGRFVVWDVDL